MERGCNFLKNENKYFWLGWPETRGLRGQVFRDRDRGRDQNGHNLRTETRGETFPSNFFRPRSRPRLLPLNFRDWYRGRERHGHCFEVKARGETFPSKFSRPRTRLSSQNFRDRGLDFPLKILDLLISGFTRRYRLRMSQLFPLLTNP